MDRFEKTRICTPSRSEGDGMEHTPPSEMAHPKKSLHVQTTPSIHYHPKKQPNSIVKPKPKFVPFEPYKAAVSPIVPLENNSLSFLVDSQKVNSLASSVMKLYSNLERQEPSPQPRKECSLECGARIKFLEEKLALLEKDKKELISQCQVQVEVNSELKNMLVASMGEDVQLKVQIQTEDKALLGKQVLLLSDRLEEAADEAEHLTIQANVWESKFKASSLLVKELAHWKASLSKKLNSSIQALDSLLSEHKVLFEQLSTAHRNLSPLVPNYNASLRTMNLVQIAEEVKTLSMSIKERSTQKQVYDQNMNVSSEYTRQLTRAENLVSQLFGNFEQTGTLTNLEQLREIKNDPVQVACAVLPHICAKSSSNFCKHCCGDVKIL